MFFSATQNLFIKRTLQQICIYRMILGAWTAMSIFYISYWRIVSDKPAWDPQISTVPIEEGESQLSFEIKACICALCMTNKNGQQCKRMISFLLISFKRNHMIFAEEMCLIIAPSAGF